MKLDRKVLREHENKILLSLADFYYEHGYKADAYVDPETGGIYEHKLAKRIGYKIIQGNKPPPEFTAATIMLEAQGYVRRMQRRVDFPILGIWPTFKGLDRAEYLKQPWYKKIIYKIKEHSSQIFISIVTTLITLILSSIFGLFGLGSKTSSDEATTNKDKVIVEEKAKAHNRPN